MKISKHRKIVVIALMIIGLMGCHKKDDAELRYSIQSDFSGISILEFYVDENSNRIYPGSFGNIINGTHNTIRGNDNIIHGNGNAAIGNNININGNLNIVTGDGNVIIGDRNGVHGHNSHIDGHDSLISGNNNLIYGDGMEINGNNRRVGRNIVDAIRLLFARRR